jgi:hypothetical protein
MNTFMQVTADKDTLYALDAGGNVWEYTYCGRWLDNHGEPVSDLVDGGRYERIYFWQMLSSARGWPGWPLTAGEQAQHEVEELLR